MRAQNDSHHVSGFISAAGEHQRSEEAEFRDQRGLIVVSFPDWSQTVGPVLKSLPCWEHHPSSQLFPLPLVSRRSPPAWPSTRLHPSPPSRLWRWVQQALWETDEPERLRTAARTEMHPQQQPGRFQQTEAVMVAELVRNQG